MLVVYYPAESHLDWSEELCALGLSVAEDAVQVRVQCGEGLARSQVAAEHVRGEAIVHREQDVAAAVDQLHAALRPGGRVFVGDMHFGPHLGTRLLRQLYRGIMGGNGDDVHAALRSRFSTIELAVGADGRTPIPPEGRSWPPIAFLLARKTI